MAVTCNGGNGCTITCTGNCCFAVYNHKTGICEKGCCDDTSTRARVARKVGRLKGSRQSKLTICVKGMEMRKAAMLLDVLCPNVFAVPASKIDKTISRTVRKKAVRAIGKSFGFVLVRSS